MITIKYVADYACWMSANSLFGNKTGAWRVVSPFEFQLMTLSRRVEGRASAAALQRMQPLGVSDATAAVAKKAEVAIPHRPGPGSVAAFDRTGQIASDEFSVINQ